MPVMDVVVVSSALAESIAPLIISANPRAAACPMSSSLVTTAVVAPAKTPMLAALDLVVLSVFSVCLFTLVSAFSTSLLLLAISNSAFSMRPKLPTELFVNLATQSSMLRKVCSTPVAFSFAENS